jgi:hypothetical protein
MKYILYPSTLNTLIALTPSNNVESALKDIPLNTSYKIVDNVEYIDGTFFDAYEFDQEVGAKINILKAKEIWKDKFRTARKPILEKLDVEYMRALEVGNIQKQQEIASKKQALRDVTNISLPDTLEGIKNTWPEILK